MTSYFGGFRPSHFAGWTPDEPVLWAPHQQVAAFPSPRLGRGRRGWPAGSRSTRTFSCGWWPAQVCALMRLVGSPSTAASPLGGEAGPARLREALLSAPVTRRSSVCRDRKRADGDMRPLRKDML